MIRTQNYNDLPNCLEISNGEAKLIVSTDVGPRILFYGFDGGENILGWHPTAEVNTPLGKWKPYGGHRLWRAPESMPLSYAPDNNPVEFAKEGEFSVRLLPPLETATHLQKEMTITLAASGTAVNIDHKITNRGDEETEIAAWALTIMRGGGEVIIPNEPFKPYGPETLLPVRSMALWSYTDFTDPRWKFEKDAIHLRVDEKINTQQKIGVLNRQAWAGYKWEDLSFVKKFAFDEDAVYPDMNSNMEVYTDGGFVEIETLSPLKKLAPGDAVQHHEHWELLN
ncbi:MAG TPA: hypothetical protein VL325_03370 [Pyrinomonadaceae bacterium]|nr:hypothetical protein [Pyrinomonadaceae bacterium]